MFFYISFLRPPPLQASLTGKLFITPQIANDLRTELHDGTQDIFFFWSQSIEAQSPTPKPSKLTTWRTGSTYKEISVPLPPSIRHGQSWSLVLTTQTTSGPHCVNLNGDTIGTTPFPVISMPILFTRNTEFPLEKQSQIQRLYCIPTFDGEFACLKVREHTSFDLDKKVWDSGVGLSSWLVDLRDNSPSASRSEILAALRDSLFSLDERRILELGTGSGVVSLTLATLRSSLGLLGNSIIATDLATAMPLLESNILANEHLFPSARPQATVLDWNAELPSSIQTIEGGFDAIIMADIAYNTSSFSALIGTLSNLIRLAPYSKPPLLLLGYKERDPNERTLWNMAKDIGVVFESVGERKGCGGAAIEVWVGRVERDVAFR